MMNAKRRKQSSSAEWQEERVEGVNVEALDRQACQLQNALSTELYGRSELWDLANTAEALSTLLLVLANDGLEVELDTIQGFSGHMSEILAAVAKKGKEKINSIGKGVGAIDEVISEMECAPALKAYRRSQGRRLSLCNRREVTE